MRGILNTMRINFNVCNRTDRTDCAAAARFAEVRIAFAARACVRCVWMAKKGHISIHCTEDRGSRTPKRIRSDRPTLASRHVSSPGVLSLLLCLEGAG